MVLAGTISLFLIVVVCNVTARDHGFRSFVQKAASFTDRLELVADMPKAKQERIEGYLKKAIGLYNKKFERFQKGVVKDSMKEAYIKNVYNGTNMMDQTYQGRNKVKDTVVYQKSNDQIHGKYMFLFADEVASCLIVFQVAEDGTVSLIRDNAACITSALTPRNLLKTIFGFPK